MKCIQQMTAVNLFGNAGCKTAASLTQTGHTSAGGILTAFKPDVAPEPFLRAFETEAPPLSQATIKPEAAPEPFLSPFQMERPELSLSVIKTEAAPEPVTVIKTEITEELFLCPTDMSVGAVPSALAPPGDTTDRSGLTTTTPPLLVSVACTQTDLVTADVDKLQSECQALRSENVELKEKHSRLSAREESLQVECRSLRSNNVKLLESVSILSAKEASFQAECQALRSENIELKEKASRSSMREDGFQKEEKIRFYTGLPSLARFTELLHFLSASVPQTHMNVLTQFQELLLVLVKFKLNLLEEDLAHRFGISQSTVSRVFRKWVHIMNVRLARFVRWPDREELRSAMPPEFKKCCHELVCIIDTTELLMERPMDLKTRAQTWSKSKQQNTVKFLIGITPQGTVSFLSQAWAGGVPDQHVTENCGILDRLSPGDVVFANRGLTAHDSVGLYCAEVIVSPLSEGRKQLDRRELDPSMELNYVRFHSERVIGALKRKYAILKGALPVTWTQHEEGSEKSMVNKIVLICCALFNLCESAVPLEGPLH
ncbi:uncharacterized protein LOC102352482 isoform X2 [Latimeria chalumnae]|nr:PREDICTED: uncharacterized protein LOC102352482 [Latimeria chalumnae]|eukprot:XP_006014567.2 PREDICTED: uncharacterized protein LOC102352482 [Latimeria chalumnae]